MSAISRYSRVPLLDMGGRFGTSHASIAIRRALKSNALHAQEIISRGADRLDTMAGTFYGDGRYWWILAAASDIGWGMQVPPGTVIRVPALSDVIALVG